MEHNLKTLMEILNRYVGVDKPSGLIPITPMHMEINRIKEELQNLKQEKNMLKWLEENIGDWKASHVSNTLCVFIEDLLGVHK